MLQYTPYRIGYGESGSSISTITGNTTLTTNYTTVLLDGSTNTVTVTLPSAVGISGALLIIKCIDDTYQCDIAAYGSEEIDGSTDNVILVKNESKTLQSDGANWWVI